MWTHVVAAVAFPVWHIWSVAHLYGIDTRHDWWTGLDRFLLILVLPILVVMPVAVVAEAWGVNRSKGRWPAHIAVIGYLAVAGFVSFIPTGLRFFGDTSPTPVSYVVTSVLVYGSAFGAQLASAYVACLFWQRS